MMASASGIKWNLRRTANGWEGEISLPGGIATKAPGQTKAKALRNAAGLADQIMSNPVLQTALPPQAALALKGIKLLSNAKAAGAIKNVVFKAPGLKKLAKIFSW